MAKLVLRNTLGYMILGSCTKYQTRTIRNLISNSMHMRNSSLNYIDQVVGDSEESIPFSLLGNTYLIRPYRDAFEEDALSIYKQDIESPTIVVRRNTGSGLRRWFMYVSYFNLTDNHINTLKVNDIIVDITGLQWVIEVLDETTGIE